MSNDFQEMLKSWQGGPVTIVNPQSFRRGAITDAIDLETFEAKLVRVGPDFVEVSYEATPLVWMDHGEQTRAMGVDRV